MRTQNHRYLSVIFSALLFFTATGASGKTVEITDAEFDDSSYIDNPYWPLIAGNSSGYMAVTENECESTS